MRKILSLFAAVLFAGSMMAGDAQKLSANVDLSQGVLTPKDGETPAYMTWSVAGGKIIIKQLQGKNKSSVVGNYNTTPRIYKGHILEFEAIDGYLIDTVSMRVGVGGKDYAPTNVVAGTSINALDTTVVSNTTDFEVKCTKVNKAQDTIICKSGAVKFYLQPDGQMRTDSIYIAYTKPASSEPEIAAGDLTFGTFVPGVSASQKLAVSGDNLTAAITASFVTGTAFSVTGDLTTAGGELTIAVIATESGDYTDKLNLTSGSATKQVTVTAHVVATTGKGTKENPFTVTDAKNLNNTFSGDKFWVQGFILGGMSSKRDIVDTVNTAIGLAATMENPADTIAVQLPNNNVRKALNAKDNNVVGCEVKVYGNLEAYLQGGLGMKNTNDYVMVNNPNVPKSNDASISWLKVGDAALSADENKVFSFAAANSAPAELAVTFALAEGATADRASGFKIAVPEAGAAAVDSAIVVTAEDGTTKVTYHVSVTRKAADAPKSTDATIKELKINNTVVAEKEGVFAYEVAANENLAQVSVAFILNDANAVADKDNPFTLAVPASSEAAASEATINVTAEDGTTKKAYKVSVTRKPAEQGIADINATEKAVKLIENGQLVIIKGGVRYNVFGTVIK